MLYARYFDIQLKSQLEYRQSFVMLLVGQALMVLSTFAGVYFILQRFGAVGRYSAQEIYLVFSVAWMSFAVAESLARGFDRFSAIISNGTYDRILLRPRSTILQVLGQTIDFTRLGRLAQATVILLWTLLSSPLQWNFLRALTLGNMLLGGSLLFSALFLLQAGVCFYTTEGIEVMNVFTDGGRTFGAYPMDVYGAGVLRFYTYVVPLALVQTYPLEYLTGRSSEVYLVFLPLLAALFFAPAYLVWRLGNRRYASTGS